MYAFDAEGSETQYSLMKYILKCWFSWTQIQSKIYKQKEVVNPDGLNNKTKQAYTHVFAWTSVTKARNKYSKSQG